MARSSTEKILSLIRALSLDFAMPITLTVNGQSRTLDIDPDTPLLWAIRETLGLTGTKFGCGIAAVRRVHGARQRQGRAVVRHAGVVG